MVEPTKIAYPVRLDDLINVKGIGPVKLEKIRMLITAS